jgi:hypothetical protein
VDDSYKVKLYFSGKNCPIATTIHMGSFDTKHDPPILEEYIAYSPHVLPDNYYEFKR